MSTTSWRYAGFPRSRSRSPPVRSPRARCYACCCATARLPRRNRRPACSPASCALPATDSGPQPSPTPDPEERRVGKKVVSSDWSSDVCASDLPPATLLDGNVLIALADQAHVHHELAVRWFSAQSQPFATCPITQGTLLRMLLRHGAVASPQQAASVLAGFVRHPRHRFWADAIDYSVVSWSVLLGQPQVTAAYIAALSRHQQGPLDHLDRGPTPLPAEAVGRARGRLL